MDDILGRSRNSKAARLSTFTYVLTHSIGTQQVFFSAQLVIIKTPKELVVVAHEVALTFSVC